MNTANSANTNVCTPNGCTSPAASTQTTRAAAPAATVIPRCEVREVDGVVLVTLAMPGVAEADVEVSVERNVLTVRGAPRAADPEGMRLVWREFAAGEYRRSFELADDVDSEAITATTAHGLLTLRVPRKQPSARRIAVTSA